MFDEQTQRLMEAAGVSITPEILAGLSRFVAHVIEANEAMSLVSSGDVHNLWTTHIPDALSLIPVVKRLGLEQGRYLDIGSGAGFPGLVLAISMPTLSVVLVERSEKKARFLSHVVQEMALSGIRVVCGEFPQAVSDFAPNFVTARAVEKPDRVHKSIARFLGADAVFFCQTAELMPAFAKGYEVELIDDELGQKKVRRGTLRLIRRSK